MEFIEFTENRKREWNDFMAANNPASFLQSFEWGEFQESVGHNAFHFAVCEEENILALALVVQHGLPFGMKYWYIPRGPVISSDVSKEKENEIFTLLMGNISRQAKGRGIIFVRMDPAYGKDKINIFEKSGLRKIAGSVQPQDTLVLDLSRSEDELLAGMKQKTRYNIRLAEKKGVIVSSEAFGEKSFEDFWRLTEETSRRDGIVSHDREYYRKMLETLGGDNRDGLKGRLYIARCEGKAIAANIVLSFGPYCVYLHGASSDARRNLMAPYLLQWKQIQDAKNVGCCVYDFWGITIGGKNPRWEGITRFKKGFGGSEVSYAGLFDMPINKHLYKIYTLLKSR